MKFIAPSHVSSVSHGPDVYLAVDGFVECPPELGLAVGLRPAPEPSTAQPLQPATPSSPAVPAPVPATGELLAPDALPGMTVGDVRDALKKTAHPPEVRAALRDAEIAGKNRVGVLDALV